MSKGSVLLNLKKMGLPVPELILLEEEDIVLDCYQLKLDSFFGQLPSESYFAVRSSANVEDSAQLSFAGLFKSVLQVKQTGVSAAIETVFNSSKSPRVSAYCHKFGVDPSEIKMGVIVQRMVPAEISGVVFSIEPVSNKPVILIEGAYGLGEAVVSGAAPTDKVRYDPISKKIISYIAGFQETKLVINRETNKAVMSPVALLDQSRRKFSNQLIEALAGYAEKLSQMFATAVDIEWSTYAGEILILQARPLTHKLKQTQEISK